MSTDPPPDWRSLPRKPAELKRCRQVCFRVTDSEYARLQALAREAGLPMSDYVIGRALGKRRH